MTRAQELIDRAREGQTMLGTVISSPDPVLAERIAAGFDFVWIDLEHSALSARDLQTLAIAARAGGAAALVRLPSSDSDLLTAVLDAGLDGVVAPRVDDAAQAQRFVSGLSYPPAGWRGFAPRRGNGFGNATAKQDEAPRVLSIVQIETRKGLADVEQIAAVKELDWLVVGISDLSFELGTPLQPQAPEVLAGVERVRAAAAQAGVRFGLAASGDERALFEAMQRPLDMLLYSSDARIYAGAIAAAHEVTAAALARAREGWRR
jgi:2-keto-3-deoxy-L-rhamnonate aldolase RhmA